MESTNEVEKHLIYFVRGYIRDEEMLSLKIDPDKSGLQILRVLEVLQESRLIDGLTCQFGAEFSLFRIFFELLTIISYLCVINGEKGSIRFGYPL